MWKGVFPAVTTKFNADETLDFKEMERCFALQIDAGVDGLIVAGSLGEGPMLNLEERTEVFKIAKSVAGKLPVLITINEAGTREGEAAARAAAKAGADGLMVVPSMVYHTNPLETVAALNDVANAGGLPVMIYSNKVAYRVDVTCDIMEELSANPLFVAVKESSDDIRRSTDIINRFEDRFALFTGVDNLAYEALSVGAVGWVAGLVVAFPKETVAIYRLMRAGRQAEALDIYRWFRPLLDLDVSNYLVQNIKLAEAIAIGSSEHVRRPRKPLAGDVRNHVEKTIRNAITAREEWADS
jgi:1-pyrroline-4-hydroxy-2-carboxylate deaminase